MNVRARIQLIIMCHRERTKKAVDDKRAEEKRLREKERRVREEARAAERERKKAEALDAKRYPMEDLQLLQELKEKALNQGFALTASNLKAAML